MPIVNAYIESLPYIDPEPTPAERAAAQALITSELPSSTTTTHPSLPPLTSSSYLTPLLTADLHRAATGTRLTAIDLTRYESPPTPSPSAPLSPTTSLLARAYTAYSYMKSRAFHLDLLSKHGKNAWLIGNWQLEEELKRLERELAAVKREVDLLSLARSGAQKEVEAEMRMLEEAWKKGVARVLETEVATVRLRQEVLEEMKKQTE